MKQDQDELSSYILDAISNDFEDFEMIAYEVALWAAADGILVSRDQIWKALCRLLRTGDAKAFWMYRDGRMAELEVLPESESQRAYYISRAKAATRGL